MQTRFTTVSFKLSKHFCLKLVYFKLCYLRKRNSRIYAKETKNAIYWIRHCLRWKIDPKWCCSHEYLTVTIVWTNLSMCDHLEIWRDKPCHKKKTWFFGLFRNISNQIPLNSLCLYSLYKEFMVCKFLQVFHNFLFIVVGSTITLRNNQFKVGEKCIHG